jgi:hypothetical protein
MMTNKEEFEEARKNKSIDPAKLNDVCPGCDQKYIGPAHACHKAKASRSIKQMEKACEIQPYATRVASLLEECKYGRVNNIEGSNAMIPLLKEGAVAWANHSSQFERGADTDC